MDHLVKICRFCKIGRFWSKSSMTPLTPQAQRSHCNLPGTIVHSVDNFWNNDLKWRLQKKFDHSLRLWFGNDHIQKVLIPNSVLTPHSRLWLAEISHRPKPSFLEFYKLQNRNKNRKYFKCSIRTPEKGKKVHYACRYARNRTCKKYKLWSP